MVRKGNPKAIRTVSDLVRKDVRIVNREEGAGARLLLDHHLALAAVPSAKVKGYQELASSHLDVAQRIAYGQVDAGIGIGFTAGFLGLDFIPLQQERYDLVIPTVSLASHPTLSHLFDTIASHTFRSEIGAVGGYDTQETGTIRKLN